MIDSAEDRDRVQMGSLELKHLRYAVAAADHGSFRGAADILLIRQSTLSRCVRELEHSIGMIVFDRTSGGVRVTEAGRQFLRAARSILGQLETVAASARMSGRGEAGLLTIGFFTSLSAGNLRAALTDYVSRYPGVELGMLERSRNNLEIALRNGAIDVAVITGDRALLGSQWMPLWSERILVVLPQMHPLAAKSVIAWTDLRADTLLLGSRDPGPTIRELFTARVTSPEERPRIVCYDVSSESLKSLVGASFGVGLSLEASLGANFEGVVHREIQDGSGPARVGVSAHWLGDNENPALRNFLQLLRERYPSPEAKA